MTPVPRDPEQEIRVRPPTVLTQRCEHCGRPVGPKHRETCLPEHECGCRPGWRHEPGCELAHWPDGDAA